MNRNGRGETSAVKLSLGGLLMQLKIPVVV